MTTSHISVKQDEYGNVLNDHKTYLGLVVGLLIRPVVFAWTDEQGSHLDILMTYEPAQYGNLQRGMNSKTDLFIAVSGYGMFGFELNGFEKYPTYVGEKLGMGGSNLTTIALAEMINAVCNLLEVSRNEI